jgi:hypothetical protein
LVNSSATAVAGPDAQAYCREPKQRRDFLMSSSMIAGLRAANAME